MDSGSATPSAGAEQAVDQLQRAIAWWARLLDEQQVRTPADAKGVAVRLMDLMSGDAEDRVAATEAAQDFCVGYGDPIVHRPVPDEWWATPLGAFISESNHPRGGR